MDKLNRQQLGSGNWGQSINANWDKIEAGFSQISSSVDTLQRLIENNQFGVAFGGFLRLDKVEEESGAIVNLGQEAAKRGEIWVTRNAVPATELYTREGSVITPTAAVLAYTVGDITTGEHTDIDVPVNRVFRIIGSWDPTTDWDPQDNWSSNGTETIAISPYDETLTSGGLLVYTATQFTRLFWNSLIYRPNPVLKGTKIVFEPVEDNETGNVEVPYPSALCKSVAQQVELGNLPTNKRVPITSLGQIKASGGTITDYIDVKFVTIGSNGEFEPFNAWYKIGGSNDQWYVEFDGAAAFDTNDYAIIMYYGNVSTLEEIEQLNSGTGVADVQEESNNG